MKFHSENKIQVLGEELQFLLNNFRNERNFNFSSYISQKAEKINEYMSLHGLNACVIAVSGGIDSAIVYALICEARKQKDSPIKKVVPVSLPAYKSVGVTNQDSAFNRAKDLVNKFGLDNLIEIDISSAHSVLKSLIDDKLGIFGKEWADGQLVPYLRTPTYYYITSLLSQEDYRSIICGTTNKDEGAYLGYFGKASDGMVDVQLISDIHKSEVYKVANALCIPDSIISAIPTGDMFDGRVDEEVFGVPYDFVELYIYFLGLSHEFKGDLLTAMSEETKQEFKVLSSNVEKLHSYNKHKYIGASPAVHLDVIESRISGGWDYNTF